MNISNGIPELNSPCKIDIAHYQEWKSFRLSNGILELFVVPEIGGRIIQLRLGSCEHFYVNPRHAGRVYRKDENNFETGRKDYGGCKVWPAPQGWEDDAQWPGPPDPILDGGPYQAQIVDDKSASVALQMESSDDEYTGLRFSREIRLFRGSATVQIRHLMRNISLRPIRWALWQVSQQIGHRELSVTVPSKSFWQIYGNQSYTDYEVLPKANLWRLSYSNQVAKFIVNPEAGWLATSHGNLRTTLVETFPIFHDLTYPDGGAVEIWVNGKGTFTIHGDTINMEDNPDGFDQFIETEVLSPLVNLEPGQQYTFQTCWHCCATNGGTITGVNSCAAIERPLTARIENGSVRVKGSFGLFRSGVLEVVPIHRNGKPEPVLVVGPVGPLEACVIDECFPFESSLYRVALRLRGAGEELLGTVDTAMID